MTVLLPSSLGVTHDTIMAVMAVPSWSPTVMCTCR
jgi:hypothetical protein